MAAGAPLETLSRHRCFGGEQGFYRHESEATGLPMRLGVYVPPLSPGQRAPVLYYLAGLSCSEETFLIKAGAQRLASELGLILVAPDTSPRGTGIPGEADDWELGTAAGFYLDATQAPWAPYFQMYSYVTAELPRLLSANFPVDLDRQGIMGHSMGGHGALVLGLRNPAQYRSISALSPICAPSQVPWGEKAFSAYLGADRAAWAAYDATELVRRGAAIHPGTILIHQGTEDKFLDRQLRPWLLEEACRAAGQHLIVRHEPGYDHGYYFVQSFIEDHLRHHASALK